jgi:hypothetical protein
MGISYLLFYSQFALAPKHKNLAQLFLTNCSLQESRNQIDFPFSTCIYFLQKTWMAITTDARRIKAAHINISSVTRHPHVPNSTVFFHFPLAWVL